MALPHGRNKTGLTPKQALFVKEYLVDLNSTQAATRAGYSKKTANEQGCRLLANVNIQSAIRAETEKRSEKVGFSAENTLRELQNIVHFNVKNVFDDDGRLKSIKDLDDSVASAIASVEFSTSLEGDGSRIIKLRPYDKTKAVDMAMKHFGLFEKDNEQQGSVVAAILKARGRCKS